MNDQISDKDLKEIHRILKKELDCGHGIIDDIKTQLELGKFLGLIKISKKIIRPKIKHFENFTMCLNEKGFFSLESKNFDQKVNGLKGWTMFEAPGISIIDKKALATIKSIK